MNLNSRCRMRHVVFDECDMLLSGGFEAPTRLILAMLKELDRARMVSAICDDLGITEDGFRSLPLLMRRTGLAGELKMIRQSGIHYTCSLPWGLQHDVQGPWHLSWLHCALVFGVHQASCMHDPLPSPDGMLWREQIRACMLPPSFGLLTFVPPMHGSGCIICDGTDAQLWCACWKTENLQACDHSGACLIHLPEVGLLASRSATALRPTYRCWSSCI